MIEWCNLIYDPISKNTESPYVHFIFLIANFFIAYHFRRLVFYVRCTFRNSGIFKARKDIIPWNFELKVVFHRALEHDDSGTNISVNNVVFMEIAKNLKNLFNHYSAYHIIKMSSEIISFSLQISTFKIFFNDVITGLGLQHFKDVAYIRVSTLHNADLGFNAINILFGISTCQIFCNGFNTKRLIFVSLTFVDWVRFLHVFRVILTFTEIDIRIFKFVNLDESFEWRL